MIESLDYLSSGVHPALNYDLEHVANVTGLDPNATLTFIVSIPQSTVSRSSPGSGISHMDLLILH
jgi:hypothetical protein